VRRPIRIETIVGAFLPLKLCSGQGGLLERNVAINVLGLSERETSLTIVSHMRVFLRQAATLRSVLIGTLPGYTDEI